MIRPHRPLPWSIVENHYGTKFIVSALHSGDMLKQSTLIDRIPKDKYRRRDREYQVHAANNYPILVTELARARKYMPVAQQEFVSKLLKDMGEQYVR
jgi:hypothetical protein